ncbi:MAG: radical SAM family heme chaperone HemW [Synergistaceae bacterium]|nr:radical SAM family heme chaperone HemW [Synergistaceae bacterium]
MERAASAPRGYTIANDASLYIHVPFCAAKCPYCSFYSRPPGPLEIEAWLDALDLEARLWRERIGGHIPLRTVYVGGGTPTLLSLSQWRRLVAIVEQLGDTSSLLEASVEADPSSLSEGHIAFWDGSFFSRISLGVQSLHDTELRTLGRRHDARDGLRAMERVAASRLALSADLIFGAPGQTIRSWDASLRGCMEAGAVHLSTYQLTLSPDTPMGRTAPALPDGYPLYRWAQWLLPKKGLVQYEISSFARPGAERLHNLAYWRQEDVLALGPSAWGYIDGRRWAEPPTLEAWFDASKRGFPDPLARGETLRGRERAIEAAILALRTRWGIDKDRFAARWGRGLLGEIEAVLSSLPSRLIRDDGDSVALTSAGMRVGNAIWAEVLALA